MEKIKSFKQKLNISIKYVKYILFPVSLYFGIVPTQIGIGKSWVSYMIAHNTHYGNFIFGQPNKVMHYVNGGVNNGI